MLSPFLYIARTGYRDRHIDIGKRINKRAHYYSKIITLLQVDAILDHSDDDGTMVHILAGFQLLGSVKSNRFFNKSGTSTRRAASTYCVLNIGNSENEAGQREEQDMIIRIIMIMKITEPTRHTM